jgi:hypothetical protein
MSSAQPVYRTRHAVVRKAVADTRTLSVKAALTFPLYDLAGDWVEPSGCDFSSHRRDPWVDLEHTGRRVGWARKSLSAAGSPYSVELSTQTLDDGTRCTLPFGTTYFDPSDRVSSQVFALVAQDALPGVSLEFRPVPGFCKSLGRRSPLEARDAMRFDRADVVRWTHCATPVNAGALTVVKSLRSPVPPELAKVLSDNRVAGEVLCEPIRKALAAYTTPRKAIVAGGFSAVVMKAREPYQGAYPGDKCPECGEPPKSACRCIRNDRFCPNGHVWERLEGGEPALLDKAHGSVVKAYGGMTLAAAEQKRRTWLRVEKKAMDETETAYDAAADTGATDTAPAEDTEGQATPTAQAAYDVAQMLRDACEHAKDRVQQSEHTAGKKKLTKLCDAIEALIEKFTATGDMVAADVGGDGDMDEDDDEPEVEAEATEPDDEDGGVMKAFRAPHRRVYRKAVKRFTLAEVAKGTTVTKAEAAELARLRKKNERLRREFEAASRPR